MKFIRPSPRQSCFVVQAFQQHCVAALKKMQAAKALFQAEDDSILRIDSMKSVTALLLYFQALSLVDSSCMYTMIILS